MVALRGRLFLKLSWVGRVGTEFVSEATQLSVHRQEETRRSLQMKEDELPYMPAMASVDDDFVTLVCANSIEVGSEGSEILISTEDIRNWDLNSILSFPKVKIRAYRNRLFEQSTYFRSLLSGSFSELLHDRILINWNLSIFIDVLKCMHSCPLDVTSSNFLPLFEGALFFGVEMLLLKCKTWLIDVCSSSVDLGSAKLEIKDLIQIWNFGLEHANDYVPELCANYLARNFMSAFPNGFFQNIPHKLLMYSIKHPCLTVDSEMHLLYALEVWLNHDTTDLECSNDVNYKVLLSEIRLSLLPLWFAAGKIKSSLFSNLAAESIGSILRLLKILSSDSLHELGDSGLNHFRFRLTKYSKIVNLSGCPQITSALILLSLLPSSYCVNLPLRSHKQLLNFLQTIETDQTQISRELSPILSFKNVVEVDISKCSRIHLETALEIFSKFFPSLQILKAAYLLNFKTAMIYQLLQKCPSVCQVDLTVDSSPLIFENLSVVSSTEEMSSKISSLSYGADNIMGLKFFSLSGSEAWVSNITKLSLEGRTDVTDEFLLYISKCCTSLQYLNLKGCTTVTDVGLSNFIRGCNGLKSIIVCDTSFGINSATALCFRTTSHGNSSAEYGTQPLHSPAFNLQELHVGGCKGVDKASLLMLMTQTQSLSSLCLRDTQLDDHVLSSFTSSSLEILDVSNTIVSIAGLKCIVRKNPGLKILKARGCKNLISFPYVSEELYNELGKMCKLEELRIGWGLSYFSLEVLKPAITSLKILAVGMGGSLGEDALSLLPTSCPALESMILYFQIISDRVMIEIITSLKNLKVLALCYCLGDISVSAFMFSMPNLRILRLLWVTPWMTNDHLVILTRNCGNLIELSLSGCSLLNSDSQQIISEGWPGLVSIHLEECGQVSANGVSSLFNCLALEDILLRHNGNGIPKNFILGAASKLPLLRKLSLDLCDANEGDFDIPDYANRCFLGSVTIARCTMHQSHGRRPVHKETLALVWNSKNLTRTIVKERLHESLVW